MDEKENVLFIIDYQRGFLNKNSKEVIKPINSIAIGFKWDRVFQAMWFNSGNENDLIVKNVNYEDCQIDGKDASLKRLYHGAYVIPRVNKYSCITEEVVKLLRYNWNIYITGIETDACVLGTCFSLFDLGIDFKVVSEAVSSKTPELDSMAKAIMRRQFGAGSVISMTEIDVPKKQTGLFKFGK